MALSEYRYYLSSCGVDYDEAMERYENDESFYGEVSHVYFEGTYLPELKAAIKSKEWDAARFQAHKLKGAVGMVSFKNAGEIALQMQVLFDEGKPEEAAALLNKLETALQQAEEALKSVLN